MADCISREADYTIIRNYIESLSSVPSLTCIIGYARSQRIELRPDIEGAATDLRAMGFTVEKSSRYKGLVVKI